MTPASGISYIEFMKKIFVAIFIYFIFGCSQTYEKQPPFSGTAIIGQRIEMVIANYGEPELRYSNRCAGLHCLEYFIYGNHSIEFKNGVAVNVKEIH